MAITAAFCTSAKGEFFGGTHAAADSYKIALYTSTATLDATTTAYSATNEVVGAGYTATGTGLTGFTVTTSGVTAILDFTTDPSWTSATITARGALIYNSTKANKAVAVLDFTTDKTSTNGTFTVVFPAPDSTNGLLRIA